MNIALFGNRETSHSLWRLWNWIQNILIWENYTVHSFSQIWECIWKNINLIIFCRKNVSWFQEIIDFAQAHKIPLINLSSGADYCLPEKLNFPYILAPNIAIEAIQFFRELQNRPKNQDEVITIVEHHQAEKTSVPWTALNIANILGVDTDNHTTVYNWSEFKKNHNVREHGGIISIRDWEGSKEEFDIPESEKWGYAIHRITFYSPKVWFTEERWFSIFGRTAYFQWVLRIVEFIRKQKDNIWSWEINIIDCLIKMNEQSITHQD